MASDDLDDVEGTEARYCTAFRPHPCSPVPVAGTNHGLPACVTVNVTVTNRGRNRVHIPPSSWLLLLSLELSTLNPQYFSLVSLLVARHSQGPRQSRTLIPQAAKVDFRIRPESRRPLDSGLDGRGGGMNTGSPGQVRAGWLSRWAVQYCAVQGAAGWFGIVFHGDTLPRVPSVSFAFVSPAWIVTLPLSWEVVCSLGTSQWEGMDDVHGALPNAVCSACLCGIPCLLMRCAGLCCCLWFAQIMKRIQKLKGGPKGKISRAEEGSAWRGTAWSSTCSKLRGGSGKLHIAMLSFPTARLRFCTVLATFLYDKSVC